MQTEVVDGVVTPVIEVAKSPSGGSPKSSPKMGNSPDAMLSTYDQEGTVVSEDNTVTREVVSAATLPLEYQYDEDQMTANMSLAISSNIEDVKEEDLLKDETFGYASKKMYRSMRGEDFTGTDEEATQYGIDLMRKVDNVLYNPSKENLYGFVDQVDQMSPEEAQSALYMMEMFEAKEWTMSGLGEAMAYMGTDVTTYVGISTLGWGFAGKEAAKMAAKKTMFETLKRVAFSNAGAGAIEGGAYGGAFEHGKQRISEMGGQGYDATAVGTNVAIGTGFGALAGKYLPEAFEYAGEKMQKWISKEGTVDKRLVRQDAAAGDEDAQSVLQDINALDEYHERERGLGAVDLEAIDPATVKLASEGNKDAFDEVAATMFDKTFERVIGENTESMLQPMMLEKLQKNPQLVEDVAAQYGFNFKYFSADPESIGKTVGTTVIEKAPKNRQALTKQGYQDGNIWVYDPYDTHGSFADPEYTKAWRQVHELSHALTEHFMQQKYGDSRRFGALTFDRKNPYDPNDPKTYKGLSLAEAQRALEWEDVAFRTQIKILEDMGIPVDAKQAAEDFNIAATDVLVRAATGDFTDPAKLGVVPNNTTERIPTGAGLQVLKNQEEANAKFLGQDATTGVDLNEWTPVSDADIAENLTSFSKRAKPKTTNMSVESITGAQTTGSDFKTHLDNNPDLKAEYHAEIKPIADEIIADNGLEVVNKSDTSGLWEGGVNPSTQYEIKIPKGGATPEYKAKIHNTAMELAEVLEQDAIGYNTVTMRQNMPDGSVPDDVNGFVVSGGAITDDEMINIANKMGDDYAIVATGDGFKVLGISDNASKGSELVNKVDAIMSDMKLNRDIDIADIDGQLAIPNWEELKNARQEIRTQNENTTGTTGQADSRQLNDRGENFRRKEDLRSRVKDIQNKYYNKVAPQDKKLLPAPKMSEATPADVAGGSDNLKTKQKKLNAMMRYADPEKKQEIIAALKTINPTKEKKKTPKAQKIITQQEEFNEQFYSKLEHEVNNIADDAKYASPKAAIEALVKAGVKKSEIDASGISKELGYRYGGTYVTGGGLKDIYSRYGRPDKIQKRVYTQEDFTGSQLSRDEWESDYVSRYDGEEVSTGEQGYGIKLQDDATGQTGEVGFTYDDDVYVDVNDDYADGMDWSGAKEEFLDNYADDFIVNAREDHPDFDENEIREAAFDLAMDDGSFYDQYVSKRVYEAEDGRVFDDVEDAVDHVMNNMYDDYEADMGGRGDSNSFENYTIDGGQDYRMEVYQMEDFVSDKPLHQEPHLGEDYGNSMEYGQDNVQVHARIKTRKAPDGSEGDVLEEVQSQWEQDWRSQGGGVHIPTEEEKAAAQIKIDDLSKQATKLDESVATTREEQAVIRDKIFKAKKDYLDKVQPEIDKLKKEEDAAANARSVLRSKIRNEEVKDADVAEEMIDLHRKEVDAADRSDELKNAWKVDDAVVAAEREYKPYSDKMKDHDFKMREYHDQISKLDEYINESGADLASPPMENRTQYEKLVLLDNVTKSIKDGKSFFGWINGHIQNGSSISTTTGMSQAYDKEMPRIIQKATGETPYMARFEDGEPVTGAKVFWDGKKAEDLEYFNDKSNGSEWYWKIDLTDKLKAKLKDAKIQMYGVGGAALVGANGANLEGDSNE